VQQAVLSTLGDKLAVQRAVRYGTVEDSELTNQHFFVVESEDHYLSDVLKTDAQFDIRRFRGGVVVETKLEDSEQPLSVEEFEARLREVGLTPEFEQFRTRETAVFPLGTAVTIDGAQGYRHFAVACVDESLLYDDNRDQWTEIVAPSVLHQVEAGLGIEKSLSKVVQFAPQIAGQTAKRAIFSTILAALGIGAYVWMRFGTKEFALAVLVTLVHDVCLVLGLIAASHWFYGNILGRALLIDDFRFDLTVLASVLTIIGYSLNDTIVVFDRIRETRGRSGALSANLINSSINQTMSRTILTACLVFITVIMLYLFGGAGIHGFAYVMLIGTIEGAYSTVAISVPLVYQPKLLYNVVTAIAALLLVGLVALVSPSLTATVIISAVILIGAVIIMLRSHRANTDMLAGQPA
jgi:SecD/SecF fusion protein